MDEAAKKGCKYTRVPWLKEVPRETSALRISANSPATSEQLIGTKLLAMNSSFKDNGYSRFLSKTQDAEALHD